jgi:signal transduction histidine kinase
MRQAKKFLIVDDDEAERVLLEYLLAEAFRGATIQPASNTEAAEALINAEGFDAIVIDYNMPQGDGLSFATRLHEQRTDLPFILVTGVGNETLAAEAIRQGVTDYIPKSQINVDSIRRTIERAVHSSNQARIVAERSSELEQFAYALAHDFRQPIRQILTFTKLISDEIGVAAVETIDQHLHFLNEAARKLGDLVTVMSQYALLHQPPELGAVELDTIFSDVQIALSNYAVERGGEIIFGKGARICGNPALVRQVLENLIVNGMKYNSSAIPRVEVTTEDVPEGYLIRVRDNGIGIGAEHLTEIFKPLMRLHTSNEYPGTGLGLTLTKKAVVAQGGNIWCESTPGAGSVFCVVFPRPRRPSRKTVTSRRTMR